MHDNSTIEKKKNIYIYIYIVGGWGAEDRNEWVETNTKGAHLKKYCQRIFTANMTTQPQAQED